MLLLTKKASGVNESFSHSSVRLLKMRLLIRQRNAFKWLPVAVSGGQCPLGMFRC